MFNKMKIVGGIWILVVIAYIILAATMSIHNAIVQDTLTEFASSNMDGIIGVQDAVGAFPYYVWFIPGLVGTVLTFIALKAPTVG